MNNILRDKVVAAFKGVVSTYDLSPITEGKSFERPEYVISWPYYFTTGSGISLELSYKTQARKRLINLVGKLFPGQTDRRFVERCLDESIAKWIEQGHDPSNQGLLEQAAQDFLDKVERAIRDLLCYVPIEGMKFESAHHLEIAGGELHSNTSDSEFREIVCHSRRRAVMESEEYDEHYSPIEQAPVFFKTKVLGHFGRAIQRSKEEANLALNVLRLFVKSYYSDEHRRPAQPKRMGLVGTLPATGAHSSIFLTQEDNVPIEERRLGTFEQLRHRDDLELSVNIVEKLRNDTILIRLNRLLLSLQAGTGTETARRLLRAVSWFGNGSRADTIAESFLMYAISVESLLSEGRTPKETYAKRIAALVTRDREHVIHPVARQVSAVFGEELKAASCKDERFNMVCQRVVELFILRNAIAHGKVLEHDIDALDLLDLETLVRNSILSFVDGGWDTLEQFKNWMNQHT